MRRHSISVSEPDWNEWAGQQEGQEEGQDETGDDYELHCEDPDFVASFLFCFVCFVL
jgi:hypothetical protein